MDIKELKQTAVENGLCKKWTERWTDDWTEKDLIAMIMSFDGIEFIAKKNFPSLGALERATKNLAEQNDLYIKKTNDIKLKSYTYKSHFVGCKCNIDVPDFYVGIIYISRGSDVVVKVGRDCDIIVKSTIDCNVAINDYPFNNSTVKSVNLKKDTENEC